MYHYSLPLLRKVCDRILTQNLNLGEGSELFILLSFTAEDEKVALETFLIYEIMAEEAKKLGIDVSLMFFPSRQSSSFSPESFNILRGFWALKQGVNEFMKEKFSSVIDFLKHYGLPDVIYIVKDNKSLGRDKYGLHHGYSVMEGREKIRDGLSLILSSKVNVAFSSPLPINVFIKSNTVDLAKLVEYNESVYNKLINCEKMGIESSPLVMEGKGVFTSLTAEVEGKNIFTDNGYFTEENRRINIPPGEVFFTPTNLNGTLIVDGLIEISKYFFLEHPLLLKISGRELVVDDMKGKGEIFENFKKYLSEIEEKLEKFRLRVPGPQFRTLRSNLFKFGEVGVGTNPSALIGAWPVQIEKRLGTLHFGLGSGWTEETRTIHRKKMVIGVKSKLTVFTEKNSKKEFILRGGKFLN